MSDQQTIVPPSLEDVFEQFKRVVFTSLNCIQIGRIQSFNATEQTAEIEIQVRRQVRSEVIDYPLLVDCPVFVLQGGGAYIDMPISSGDYCIVLFNDRNIDTWWNTANVAEPRNKRKHSLSDGMALVGINPRTAVRDIDGNVVRILGTSGPGAEQPAARETDPTFSDATLDSSFWTWVTTVSTVLNGLAPGSIPPPFPSSLTGRIDKGSDEVLIG